jgi:hypothetical protein
VWGWRLLAMASLVGGTNMGAPPKSVLCARWQPPAQLLLGLLHNHDLVLTRFIFGRWERYCLFLYPWVRTIYCPGFFWLHLKKIVGNQAWGMPCSLVMWCPVSLHLAFSVLLIEQMHITILPWIICLSYFKIRFRAIVCSLFAFLRAWPFYCLKIQNT